MMEYFHNYVRQGFQPIAIYRQTKKPAESNWNQNWSADRWKPYFASSEFNMGILLGHIVDVEGDTPEANEFLQNLLANEACPRYRSSKSIHYLFRNPDPDLTRTVIEGIEFRAHLHQSVVPPSTHEDGTPYGWLKGTRLPIPDMPQVLLEFYTKHKRIRVEKSPKPRPKKRIRSGFKNTECKCCLNKYPIHRTRLSLEVQGFHRLGLGWLCHICRKKRKIDMREFCRENRSEFKRLGII